MGPDTDRKLDEVLKILRGDGTPDNLGVVGRIHELEGLAIRHAMVLFGPPPDFKGGLLEAHQTMMTRGGCGKKPRPIEKFMVGAWYGMGVLAVSSIAWVLYMGVMYFIANPLKP